MGPSDGIDTLLALGSTAGADRENSSCALPERHPFESAARSARSAGQSAAAGAPAALMHSMVAFSPTLQYITPANRPFRLP
jgi:hypothetical protein